MIVSNFLCLYFCRITNDIYIAEKDPQRIRKLFFRCNSGYNNNPGLYLDEKCTLCSVGKYNSDSDGVCVDCPVGLFSDQEGLSSCSSCPLGTYNPDIGGNSTNSCINCPPGTYQDELGKESCKVSSFDETNQKK